MNGVNTIFQAPKERRSVWFLTVWLSTSTICKKKKSLLPISQDKQKKYQPGNCGWETVSGIKKFIAYSFPMLRTMIQESLGVF